MNEYILEAENITFKYLDGTIALKNLSIKIPKGKKIAVIGNNGAGKTTLFLHFNGVHRPINGEVSFDGAKLNYNNNALRDVKKNVGIVFQDPDIQLFSASVYQDVSFGPLNLGWDKEKVREKVETAMRRTGIWELKDKTVHFLSYGQKKRVAIAGIVAMEPKIIILDEPTAGLDPVCSQQMMELLNEFNQSGATVLISSHNMDEVYSWADFVFVMHNGEIIGEGTPLEVYSNDELLGKASLNKPWILKVFEQLPIKEKVAKANNVPRTPDELMVILGNL